MDLSIITSVGCPIHQSSATAEFLMDTSYFSIYIKLFIRQYLEHEPVRFEYP